MGGTASKDQSGRWCGRAARGVSTLSAEDWRQVEAHRSKERPTPWQALSERYGVPVADLRAHFEAAMLPAAPVVVALPVLVAEESTWTARRTRLLRRMWCDLDLQAGEIAAALMVTERAVSAKVQRMGLQRYHMGASQ